MTDNKLNPCNKCDSECVSIKCEKLPLRHNRFRDVYKVVCEACGNVCGLYESRQEAIDAWNRRTK